MSSVRAPASASATPAARSAPIRLGLHANLAQFGLLVAVNAVAHRRRGWAALAVRR